MPKKTTIPLYALHKLINEVIDKGVITKHPNHPSMNIFFNNPDTSDVWQNLSDHFKSIFPFVKTDKKFAISSFSIKGDFYKINKLTEEDSKKSIQINKYRLNVYAMFLGKSDYNEWRVANKIPEFAISAKSLNLKNQNLEKNMTAELGNSLTKGTFDEEAVTIKFGELKGDLLPPSLCGIYEAYIIRPKHETEHFHISKLYVLIYTNKRVLVKSTRQEYDPGEVIFQGAVNNLVLRIPGIGKANSLHHFQFDLLVAEIKNDNETIYLTGVYAGTDPLRSKPVAGKIILKKQLFKKTDTVYANIKADYEEADPIDLHLAEEIGELFKKEPIIYKYLIENEFIEDTSFIQNYSYGNDLKEKKLAGTFSIFSTDSKGQFVNRVIAIIDRLGRVEIKGSFNRIYNGFARIFSDGILSINIVKRREKGSEVGEDFFFNYLIKVWWHDRREHDNSANYYHGVRTIVTLSKKPSASRIVFVKENGKDFFEKNEFVQIDISKKYKSQLAQLRNKDSLNVKEKELYLQIIGYLTGANGNLLVANINYEYPFEKSEDFGMLYFGAANEQAKVNKEMSFKLMENAILHGFNEKDKIEALKKKLSKG